MLPHELERYRQRVSTEAPYELRRHPEAARLTGLAVYAHLRGRILTDDLIDLLIETIHHIGARAERRVEHELLDDLKRVTGKQNLLFEVAGAALEKPDGVVRDVVFPVVGEQTLRDLVREAKATGPDLQNNTPHGDPEFLQRPLSPHGAANPPAPGIPLEQRTSSPRPPGDRSPETLRGLEASGFSRRRDCSG